MLRVVRASGNRKLGNTAATYRPVGPSCPSSCPMLRVKPRARQPRCYATRGHVNLAQRRSIQHSDSHYQLAGLDLVRHLVSGDAFCDDQLDLPYLQDLIRFHCDFPDTFGWGYTHRHADWDAAGLGPATWPRNLLFLASVNSIPERTVARAAGWKTARVVQSPDERDSSEVLCPYDAAKFRGMQPVPITCRTCRLCWESERDIVFVEF